MKVVLAGAYGNLGADVFRSLIGDGHEVVALDMMERDIGITTGFTFIKVDVTDPKTLNGVCDGADAVITTVGLTKASNEVTNYDIDFHGNLNLLKEAIRAKVKHFVYISVLKADMAPKVPMLHATYLFEQALKKSGLTYVIHRPTGHLWNRSSCRFRGKQSIAKQLFLFNKTNISIHQSECHHRSQCYTYSYTLKCDLA